MKVKLDLPNCAAKADLQNATVKIHKNLLKRLI